MWRNLVVASGLLVGGFCSGVLLAQDDARPRSGGGTVRKGATRADFRPLGATRDGFRRTGERPSKPETQLSDFAGRWHGKAVDYPEDGSSTDPVGIKLSISSGRLEGTAFDRFADGDEARLEDVYVVGDRLEFKVRYRTGVQMRVTLGLVGDKLKGEGIPIRSDEDRCKITLERCRKPDQPRVTMSEQELAAAESFDGRWVGVVKDRPEKGNSRHSLIVDVAVNKDKGTVQIITMGAYQQAHDDHIDNAKVRNGKLTFPLVDREGVLTTISLWSQPGEKNRLWGEAASPDGAGPAGDVKLTREDGPREYRYSRGYRRLVVDPSQLPTETDFGKRR